MNFDHIGIVTKDLSFVVKNFKKNFNVTKISKIIIDKNLGIKLVFLNVQNITYEIITPLTKISPINNVLKKNINIINHIAYKVKNFDKKITEYQKNGFFLINKPKKSIAFNNKRVVFFMSNMNFIIELISLILLTSSSENLILNSFSKFIIKFMCANESQLFVFFIVYFLFLEMFLIFSILLKIFNTVEFIY